MTLKLALQLGRLALMKHRARRPVNKPDVQVQQSAGGIALIVGAGKADSADELLEAALKAAIKDKTTLQ